MMLFIPDYALALLKSLHFVEKYITEFVLSQYLYIVVEIYVKQIDST